MNPAYLTGIGAISAQDSLHNSDALLTEPVMYRGNRLAAMEPDYELFLDVKQLRRMSRILKMGITSSIVALRDAGVAVPDGIITGTGYGCLEDTGLFISKIETLHERTLSPTPFIQSTHNTIGSQIALLLQCQGYNQTYTQESLSFESSLLDAMLLLNENPDYVLLTGAADEITDLEHEIQKRFGIFRDEPMWSLDLFKSDPTGTLHGEGAFYFALSGKKTVRSFASIDSVATFINPTEQTLADGIQDFLKRASLTPDDIDLVLAGKNGIKRNDLQLENVIRTSLGNQTPGLFKHLCGEFPTASAFAVWLGAQILRTRSIPPSVRKDNFKKDPKNILIYNSGLGDCHSLILLRAC